VRERERETKGRERVERGIMRERNGIREKRGERERGREGEGYRKGERGRAVLMIIIIHIWL
jgi:hypothetical protein